VGVTGKRSYGKATIPLFFYRGEGVRPPTSRSQTARQSSAFGRAASTTGTDRLLSSDYDPPALFVTALDIFSSESFPHFRDRNRE
jgi:hypothetical protein